MKEREAGIYPDIPNDEYHRGAGISKSGLDLIARSPMHYRFATDAANDNAREPTPSQRLGSLVHKLILEPDTFADEYAVPFEAPDDALSSSDEIKERLRDLGLKVSGAKAELIDRLREADPSVVFVDDLRDEYLDANAGKTIVTADELQHAQAIRDAVFAHPFAAALLQAEGEAELSAYWNDVDTGVLCRCRPDFWRADGILVDVKTTADASPEAFARSVLDWRYHVQAAMYLEGTQAAMMQAKRIPNFNLPHEFVFIAVETKPPHAVACYRLDAETIAIGRREFQGNIATYAECLRSGVWPAFGDGLRPLGLPEWYLARAAREAALQELRA